MAAANTKTTWNAYGVHDDDTESLLGQLAVEAGVLSVVSAEGEESRAYLDNVVEDMNARGHLVDLARPTDPDAERYEVGADSYTRDHPDFEKVLARKLLENQSVRVEPAE